MTTSTLGFSPAHFTFHYSFMKIFILLFLALAACTRPTTTISLSANVLIPLEAEIPSEEPQHPIDLMLEACLGDTANHTTFGMIECESAALEAWKEEMHRHYLALMENLDTEPKELLKKSQESWEQYYRAEAEFSTRFYLDLDGTVWHIYIVSRQREIYRQRAMSLMEFVEKGEKAAV